MTETTVDKQEAESGKVYSILAYLGFLFIVPMLAAKDNRFARFHANQGKTLFIVMVIAYVVTFVLAFIAGFTGIGILATIVSLLSTLVYVAYVVLAILGIVNAVKGTAKPLPVIGKFGKAY